MKYNVIFTRHALSDDMKAAMLPDVPVLDMSDLAGIEIQTENGAKDVCDGIDQLLPADATDVHMYGVFPSILIQRLYAHTSHWPKRVITLWGFWNGKRSPDDVTITFEFKAWVKQAVIDTRTASVFFTGPSSGRTTIRYNEATLPFKPHGIKTEAT